MLYSSTDYSTFTYVASVVSTTPENISTNYDTSSLLKTGVYDVTGFDYDLMTIDIMKELFETGDRLKLNVTSKKSVNADVVEPGGVATILSDAFILLLDSGAGETASLNKSDNSTVIIEVNGDTVNVDGVTYSEGDAFVIDGKKATVYII